MRGFELCGRCGMFSQTVTEILIAADLANVNLASSSLLLEPELSKFDVSYFVKTTAIANAWQRCNQ